MDIKKIAAVLCFLGMTAVPMSYAQDYNIMGGVSLDEFNAQAGVLMDFYEETQLFSPWDRGRVVRYSNNESNSTGFGKFVEVEYEAGFEFEGIFRPQGVFSVIFSNVKTVNADINETISKGGLICTLKAGDENSLRVLIVSKRGDLRFLEIWSGFPGIEHDGYWYWNPMFLFPNRGE
jgi:hypothetical protein